MKQLQCLLGKVFKLCPILYIFSGKGTEAMLEMTGETVFSGTDQTDETIGTVTDVGLELPPGTVDQSGSQREV